jgi:alpha-L-fucosidase
MMIHLRSRTRLGALVSVLAVLLAMLVSTPARGELQHPRQAFLRNSVAGLFLHWGIRTSPGFSTVSAWENAISSGGWSADYWVTEAQKLHAQYIVLATFHSRLGYARPYPSGIPGSPRTSRDYVQELINAGNARGVKIIYYVTDDPQHDGEDGSPRYLNSSAYSTFKGHSVDLNTRDGFGEFSYDNFVEAMQRYPGLAGFWIDNDNAYWESHNLYERVRSDRPDMTLSNNNEDTPIMDMISNEQKTGMTPSYDYPQATFTPAPRLTEADFKLPSSGNWWFDGGNSTVDSKLTIGRFITNAGSSIKALMAETAMVNGKFPSNQANFNNFFNGWVQPIWASLTGTEGGGYMYGGFKPGAWNSGAYGVTTISKTNPDLHYLHVLDRPSGSTLTLRDNGYRVTRVTDLRSGANRAFSQANGSLTITGQSTWDQFDTVFTVQTDGRVGIYPTGSVTASATASASGHAASALVDGNYLSYWDSNTTIPVSITLDLGSAKKVAYLGINQREWSVSYARSGTEQSARIRAYQVQTSTNGSTFTTATSGTLPSARGVALINLNVASARFVRLTVTSTWAASSDSSRFHQLRIDEMWVASDYAGGGGTPPPTTTVEAENAALSGSAAAASCSTCSSGAKVRFIGNNANNFATFTVTAASAGARQLTITYELDGSRSFFVSVNGGTGVEVPLTGTSWSTPASTTIPITLAAGSNTITVFNNTANAPDLDRIDIS